MVQWDYHLNYAFSNRSIHKGGTKGQAFGAYNLKSEENGQNRTILQYGVKTNEGYGGCLEKQYYYYRGQIYSNAFLKQNSILTTRRGEQIQS